MPNVNDITNLPAARVPLVEPGDSRVMSREWYRWFQNQFGLTGSGTTGTSLVDLQLQPSGVGVSQGVVDSAIQALRLEPVPQPQTTPNFAVFRNTTDLVASAINTAQAVTFDTADAGADGVYLGTPTSRVYVNEAGFYAFHFSVQADKNAGGDSLIWLWARLNGADVANTASRWKVQGSDAEIAPSGCYTIRMGAGEYFQLMWAVDSVDVILDAFAASAFAPAGPSAILTVTQVNV